MASSIASTTISLSMFFSRATASAICSSSRRFAETPATAMLSVLGIRFVVVVTVLRSSGGALLGARLHQFVGQHQLGVDQPGEGDQGGVLLPLQVDGDVVAVGSGDGPLEAFP